MPMLLSHTGKQEVGSIPVLPALQGGCPHHSLMAARFSLTTELAAKDGMPHQLPRILFSMPTFSLFAVAIYDIRGPCHPWFCVIPGAVQFCGLADAQYGREEGGVSPPRLCNHSPYTNLRPSD